jgi:hypothetical protein
VSTATEQLLARVEALCAPRPCIPCEECRRCECNYFDRTLMEVQARIIRTATEQLNTLLRVCEVCAGANDVGGLRAAATKAFLEDTLTELNRLAAEALEGE